MIEMIKDPILEKINSIEHGFFTRHGGVSQGWYDSLNCAFASPDDQACVHENRRRAMAYFGLEINSLVTVRNAHTNIAAIVDVPWLEENKPQADGMVTKLRGIVLGSDSADCPIVLFVDEQEGVIGLAHAGWRGAKSGVIEDTLKKMVSLGAKYQQIAASISPCISQSSYEVGQEFYDNFLQDDKQNGLFFKAGNKANYFQFDLLGYVRERLERCNLKFISSKAALDTYADERFFSCRRALHKGQQDFGGHLSCIYLK